MTDDHERLALDNAADAAAAVISGVCLGNGGEVAVEDVASLSYGSVPSELVEYIPQGEYVPPCPFPCSVCEQKGRQ